MASKLLEQMKNDPLVRDKAHVELYMAFCRKAQNDFVDALKHCREAERCARLQEGQGQPSEYEAYPIDAARIASGGLLIGIKKNDEARQILNEERESFDRRGIESSHLKEDINLFQCQLERSSGNPMRASLISEKALKNETLELGDKENYLRELMYSYALLKNELALKKTIIAYLKCFDPKPVTELDRPLANCQVAEAFLMFGKATEAAIYLTRAETIISMSAVRDTPVRVHLLQLQGILALSQSQLQEAEARFNKASALQDVTGEKQVLANELALACIAYKKRDLRSAKLLMTRALGRPDEDWRSCSSVLQSPEVETYLAERQKEAGDVQGCRRLLLQSASLPQCSPSERGKIRKMLDGLRSPIEAGKSQDGATR